VTDPYAQLFAAHGLSHAHRLVLDRVPDGALVLDVGCSTGYLAAEMAKRGCRVVGLEANPVAAAQARERCERVIVGDVEDPAVRADLPREIDRLVLADVLEHLRDPWTVLEDLRELLAPEGRVIVSIPNIGHWSARRALARGRFPYAEHGLFDRTHLRFFTRATARELAQRAGFVVEREDFSRGALPLEYRLPALAALSPRLTALRPELFAFQFVLTLAPR
jgi:methionine biosynthesis protein MetW